MLIYNTTFQVDDEVHDNFLIWIKESYIPEVEKHGALRTPRICRVLSHRDEGTSYSLQWEVDNSSLLHRWHQEQGARLNQELVKIFKDKVVGFPTLMEVLESFSRLKRRLFWASIPVQRSWDTECCVSGGLSRR